MERVPFQPVSDASANKHLVIIALCNASCIIGAAEASLRWKGRQHMLHKLHCKYSEGDIVSEETEVHNFTWRFFVVYFWQNLRRESLL